MKNKSFTLIELLVVIVIIGILAGVIIVSVSSSIEKANFAKAKAFSSTVQSELFSNLISEWTFDEDSGGIVKDTAGNNNGTIIGVTYVPKSNNECVFGSCYSFDGNLDYVEIIEKKDVSITQGGTISAWVSPNDLSGHRDVVVTSRQSQHNGFEVAIISGKLVFRINPSPSSFTYCESNLDVEISMWSFLSVSYDKSYIYFYKNGLLGGKILANGFLYDNGLSNIRIGKYPNDDVYGSFDGLIDDVRIYNAALTATQIKQEYVAGLNSLLANNNISKEEYNERIGEMSFK